VAIDDDAGTTTVAEIQPVKTALMAELTWAKLYTKAMHKDLGVIATVISKSQPTTTGPENEERRREIARSAAERESHCRRTQGPCWH
jgi:hypothetical protein